MNIWRLFFLCFFGGGFIFSSISQNVSNPSIDSSIVDTVIWAWNNDAFGERTQVSIDTSLHQFQIYNPLYDQHFGAAYLGVIASPYRHHDFIANQSIPVENIFLRNYYAYISHYEKFTSYNTKKPFSDLRYTYSMGGKDEMEQILNVFHTQNVNENFNFGLQYDLLSPRGQYLYQKQKSGAFSLFSNFSGQRYKKRIAVNFNKLQNQKNGGVVYEDFISEEKDIKTYNTHLDGSLASNKAFASELLRSNQFFLDHQFFLRQASQDTIVKDGQRPGAYLRHELLFHNGWRRFIDENPSDFYRNSFDKELSDDSLSQNVYLPTYDSSYYRSFSNKVLFGVNDLPIFAGAVDMFGGVEMNRQKYSFFNHHRNVSGNEYVTDYFNDFITHAGLRFSLDTNISADFSGHYVLDGFSSGEYRVDAQLSGRGKHQNIKIDVLLAEDKPDFFMYKYSSNHSFWHNTGFEHITRQRLGIHYVHDKLGFEIRGNLGRYSDYVFFSDQAYYNPAELSFLNFHQDLRFDEEDNSYYDNKGNRYVDSSMVRPIQDKEGFEMFSVHVSKSFRFWKIFSKHHLTWQQFSGADYIRLPSFFYFTTTYFDHVFHFPSTGGKLGMQFGFDLYYNTAYKGYGYAPSVSQFYPVNHSVGGYPYFDVFLNLKIKRVRLFLKYDHANYNLSPRNYVHVWHYPMNISIFKLGLSWNFYN